MVFFNSLVLLTLSAASVMATNNRPSHHGSVTVESISDCPAYSPRKTPAKDVTDLRIDDIKIIAGLGDSIMAGFAMMGVNYEEGGSGIYNISLVSEYRGHSYALGGDKGAVTLANFIDNYNPKSQGASVLSHLVSFCSGNYCKFPNNVYRPLRDNLNAAKSGAMAMNLEFELDYLIPRMKSYFISTNYKNDWKMITLQIGSNDQCASCNSTVMNQVTPEKYGSYVEAAIERIQKEVPKVVVNLLGTFKVSAVFPLSAGQAYCKPNGFLSNTRECSCSGSPENWAKMDALSEEYNKQLQRIADKFKGKRGGTFAVMYSPAPIDLSSFPIDALSNIDCFHPSLKGHKWIAKTVWNQLFTKISQKPETLKFDDKLKIRCPNSNERLPTT